MKKLIVLFIFIFFVLSISYGQWGRKKSDFEYNHGIGITFAMISAPVSNGTFFRPGIAYTPRLNFKKFSENATLSANVPMTILLPGTTFTIGSTVTGTTDVFNSSFYFDMGATVNFNYGIMATKESTSKVGFHVGMGLGYSPESFNKYNVYTNETTTSSSTAGIYVETGFRWLGFFGKNKTPNGIRFYSIVGFNDILIAGITLTKELGYKGKKKSW